MKVKHLILIICLVVGFNLSCKKNANPNPGNSSNGASECTSLPTLVWGNYFSIQAIPSQAIAPIKNDAAGNIYIVGIYNGTTTFGNFSLAGSGQFLCKIDPTGRFIYSRKISINGNPSPTNFFVEVDLSQNVFIGFPSIDPVNNGFVFNLNKYDANGNFLWSKQINTEMSQKTSSLLKVDKTGNIYIGGYYANGASPVDFDPGEGVVNLPGGTGFLEVLDNNGNFVSVKKVDADITTDFQISPTGSIYITQQTEYFFNVEKINDDGTSGGTTKLPNEKDDVLYIDFQENLYLSNFETIKKYDHNANLLLQTKSYFFSYLRFDQSGNIYLSGGFSGANVQFDQNHIITAVGNSDGYLEKLDPQGKIVWVSAVMGTKGTTYPGSSIMTDFGIEDSGNIYFVGPIFNNATNNSDLCIAQYQQCQ